MFEARRSRSPGPSRGDRSRIRAIAILAVLVLAPVAAVGAPAGNGSGPTAWDQLGGGPSRAGEAALPTGPVDVLARYRIHEPDEFTTQVVGHRLVATPDGAAGVLRENGTGDCVMVRIPDVRTGAVDRTPLEDCRSPWLQGYDAANDALIVCSVGTAETAELQSRDLDTGEKNWGVSPTDLGAPDTGDEVPWHCTGAAIDTEAGEVVVPMITSNIGADWPTHRIGSVDLTSGEVRWSAEVPLQVPPNPDGPDLLTDPSPAPPGTAFLPLSATLTGSGVLVPGLMYCVDAARCSQLAGGEPAFVIHNAVGWLRRNGTVMGMQWSHNDPSSPAEPTPGRSGGKRSGSLWATAAGDRGAVAMGNSLHLIDPRQSTPQEGREVEPTERLTDDYLGWYGPTWARDTIYLPLTRNLVAVQSDDLDIKWTHQGDFDWRAGDVVATPTGLAYHLAQHRNTTGVEPGEQSSDRSKLFVLGSAQGTVLQEVPIPLRNTYSSDPVLGIDDVFGGFSWIPTLHMTPVGGQRMLVPGPTGEVVLVGPAQEGTGPPIEVSTRYPRAGETVTVTVPDAGSYDMEEAHIVWGDEKDSTERVEIVWGNEQDGAEVRTDGAIAATHTYPEPRRYEAVVTAVHADGTTSTRTVLFDVSGSPRATPGLLGTAFLPKYQDITFGVIGILLAVGGGLVGLARVRRRRSRFQREMDAIERVADKESNPVRLDAALDERREHVRELVLDGKLDESQGQMLEDRIGEVAREARLGTLDEELSFLPIGIARPLEEMLADGDVTPWERDRFLDGLDQEDRLTDEEKDKVRSLVERWSRSDVEDRPR